MDALNLLRFILLSLLASIQRMRSRGDCESLSFSEYFATRSHFFALFGAFAWHDVSLLLIIKRYFLFGWLDSTMTSLSMTIGFLNSHIILSAVHPKYVRVQLKGSKRRDVILSAHLHHLVPSLILSLPELPKYIPATVLWSIEGLL
jgi:hypothetical protein